MMDHSENQKKIGHPSCETILPHTIHGTGILYSHIFTYIWLILIESVSKYTSLMDAMGP